MIQDIAPYRYDNQFNSRRAPKAGDLLLICRNQQILVEESAAEENRLVYPAVGLLAGNTEAAGSVPGGCQAETLPIQEEAPGIYLTSGFRLIYLFSIGREETSAGADESAEDVAFYTIDDAEPSFAGFGFRPFTIFRTAKPAHLAFAGITAAQLWRWRQDHHFCGRCGTKMKTSETERAFVCPQCHSTVYPKICPAVIVAVLHEGKILVSRYNGRPNVKNYALIAGFAEIGETIEETVHREVMEEVGVKVKNLRFYKSQPWSFSDTLLMGFYCELDGDDHITLDQEELSMAAWLTPEELPERSSEISLTAEMMENFRLGIE